MIQSFVDKWMRDQGLVRTELDKLKEAGDLSSVSLELLFKMVVSVLTDEDAMGDQPDPERVHVIDDGDYQGTMVLIVGATGYQPSTYWHCLMYYGSCSGCDSLKDAGESGDVDGVMTMALHMVQKIKRMDEP